MHTLTLLALAASCCATLTTAFPFWPRSETYKGPTGNGSFNLQVITTSGKEKYSGQWLITYHTGAGANVLVTTKDQEAATKFSYNTTNGALYSTLGPYPYLLSLTGEDIYPAPTGYSFLGFNIGSPTYPGTPTTSFSFKTPENALKFPAGVGGEHFAVCPAVIYGPGAYFPTLVYRESGERRNGTCAEVRVLAVF